MTILSSLYNWEIWIQLGISAAIFLFFLAVRSAFTRYLFKYLLSLARRRNITFAANLMTVLEKPLRWLIVLIGFIIASRYFPFEVVSHEIRIRLFRSAFIILATWALLNISTILTLLFPQLNSKLDLGVDQIVIPFITKIINIIFIALGVSIVAEEWGFNVNGFVAGLGLGGLAFALAAKDTISNLFGGIVIITEKPFTIGDWIKTPSVEGTVEDITFRSTKVRTFAQALVTVPNATLSNEPIINWSKMGKRQSAFHLRVSYQTSRTKLEVLTKQLEQMLQNHEGVHKDTIMVRFDQFSSASLDIYLYFFTTVTDYAGYLETKENINFKIMDILEQYDVEMAIPAQNLIFKNESALHEMTDFNT